MFPSSNVRGAAEQSGEETRFWGQTILRWGYPFHMFQLCDLKSVLKYPPLSLGFLICKMG